MTTTTDSGVTMSNEMADTRGFWRGQFPEMAYDILGALLLCGFTHTVEASTRGDVLITRITGYSVNRDGEQATPYGVEVVYELHAGQWLFIADQSGVIRYLKDGSYKLNNRTELQIADYISDRINEWDVDVNEFVDLVDDQEVETTELDDGHVEVEEDVIEDEEFEVTIIDGDDGGWSEDEEAEFDKEHGPKANLVKPEPEPLALPAPAKPKRGRRKSK